MTGTSTTERLGAAAVPEPAFLKACCADLWSHPGVRVLAGDHLHPGGRGLTERALDLLSIPQQARLLDLGSGPGAGAGVAAARGNTVIALDLSPAIAAEADMAPGVTGMAGDAERLPLGDRIGDGAMAECVLSAIPDKEAAAREIRRVLRPGAPFVLTDVTRSGPLPPELDSLMGWIACAGGALPAVGYVRLLEEAGFAVEHVEDHRDALVELVAQVRRRLALFQGALAAGVVDATELGIPPDLIDLGQRMLELAAAAAADGTLSYGLVLARS